MYHDIIQFSLASMQKIIIIIALVIGKKQFIMASMGREKRDLTAPQGKS